VIPFDFDCDRMTDYCFRRRSGMQFHEFFFVTKIPHGCERLSWLVELCEGEKKFQNLIASEKQAKKHFFDNSEGLLIARWWGLVAWDLP
jgi:hypothetical protein